MTKPLLSDALWEVIAPHLPAAPPKPKGGRPRVPDRAALTGILFVLRSGIPWNRLLPKELGCGAPMTCWRRLKAWQEAGLWGQLWRVLLQELGKTGNIQWSRAVVDSSSVRAIFGGRKRAPIPRIVRKTAANITCLRMRREFLWRCG